MATLTKSTDRPLSATPWGLLPTRMRVLYITTPCRTGGWLAEAFASDSACQVRLEEACGAAEGLSRLRDQTFDAALVTHQPPVLDALTLVDGLRAGGAEEPLIVLGGQSEQELSAMAFEVGADAYVCAHTATTRTLLWIVARATERHHLIRENRRLSHAERQRLEHEHHEARRILTEQRGVARDAHGPGSSSREVRDHDDHGPTDSAPRSAGHELDALAVAEPLATHYRQLLRAHVMMGAGNLSAEMSALADLLAEAGVTAPQAMHLHVQALEELVRGLGNRSARHVMTRADLLLVEVLVHLAEHYRLRPVEQAIRAAAGASAV
jgi:CheY-like chemotaxis protein